MNICHIASIKNNPCSGVCVVVPHYVNFQEEAGHKVYFVNVCGEDIASIGCQIDMNALIMPRTNRLLLHNLDIVIFHECYIVKFLRIARELVRKGIPYVIVPHGELQVEAQRKKWVKKKTANLLLFHRFIKNASVLQVLSVEEKKNTLFRKKRAVIPNGINFPYEKKIFSRKDTIKFIYIGRLEVKHKGLDILIKAFALAKEKLKEADACLHIYGPDVYGRYASVEKLIKGADMEDMIFLHHEILGNEKRKALLESDIFIQTSRYEGMPLGILEAMGYGIPCAVTTGTSMANSIDKADAGWTAGNTAEDVAEMLKKAVCEKEKWQEKGSNGSVYVKENYAWPVVTGKLIKLYENVIKRERDENNCKE